MTGTVVGGVVGSQFGGGSARAWTAGAGALYGAGVGQDWGSSVDRYQLQNKTRTSDGVFEYLPDETYKALVNPNTGVSTTIKPLNSTSHPQTKQPCRLFETTRAGTYSAIGMVCRDEYGRWTLMDQP